MPAMPDNSAHTIGDEAMRRVGWLLMKWGQLETKVSHGIYSLTPEATRRAMSPDKIGRTLEGILGHWENAHQQIMSRDKEHMKKIKELRSQIKSAATTRHTIAHSLAAIVVDAGAATVICHPNYHKTMMLTDTCPMVTFDLRRLGDELELVERFIVDAMMLNQTARLAIGK